MARVALSGQRSAGLVWVEGRCLSYATRSAYQVWRDMLHGWLDNALDATPAAMVDTLRERVWAVCPDAFNDVYPFLAWLLSLPLDDTATVRLRGIDAGPLVNAIAVESLTPVLLYINKTYNTKGAGIRITNID